MQTALSVRQQKVKTIPPDSIETSQLKSSFKKMNSCKDNIYFNSSNERKARFIQSSKVSEKEPEKQLTSCRNIPVFHEDSKPSLGSYNDLQSSHCASSLFVTSSDSSQRTKNHSLLSTDSSRTINELENATSQLEKNSNIYSNAVFLLSVSNENLSQDLETPREHHSVRCYYPPELSKFKSSFCDNSKSEFKNDSNQIQESYLFKSSLTTSPVSANSSGYFSTSQSSSFLEFENDASLSSHSNSSSSLSNSSDYEPVMQENIRNQSYLGNPYFGENGQDKKVKSLLRPSTNKLKCKLENQMSQLSLKVNTSRIEPILSENISKELSNEKFKNINLLKNGTEKYVNKRITNRPKVSYNSVYKPETLAKLNQNSLENGMLYVYDENNTNTDSAKWETFFSSRAKSQLQNCSSQRYTASNLQKQIPDPVPTKDYKMEYSVDYLLSFSEGTFIDTHCHLDYLMDKMEYKDTFTDYRREYPCEFPPSYGGCITVFCNPFTFKRTLQWKKLLSEEYIWAAFGCHPKSADHYNDSVEDDLCLALSHPQVRALGEIGLDYSERSTCSISKQKEVFRRQIVIGLAFGLPLVIHCREAYEDCFEILKELVPRNHPIHLHCFTSEWSVAQKYLQSFPTLCIGITNLVTFKSSLNVQEVVKNIPLDRLLLETDSPYFIPKDLYKKFKVSHPGMAIFVAAKVASIKNIPLKNVLMQTRINTRRVYKI